MYETVQTGKLLNICCFKSRQSVKHEVLMAVSVKSAGLLEYDVMQFHT
jgi:hypothetical protein